MSYKIVIDSCGDLTQELKEDARLESIPLELEVGDERILDDENFNQKEYLKKIAECPTCAKTSCPSPERYMLACNVDAENIYIITLSANLSGSYNSAMLAKQMFEEQYGQKNIHVFNSCSACSGETLIARKIMELEEAGKSFAQVVELGEIFLRGMDTYFILDDLETLRKNGRLSAVKALVASKLNIKPIMGTDGNGTILQLGQAVGMKKAFRKMTEFILADKVKRHQKLEERSLMITHVDCPERAELIRDFLLSEGNFKDVQIVEAGGVSTTYANAGGIVVTV